MTFDYDRFSSPEPSVVRRALIGREPVVVALPESHPLAGRSSLCLADLADEAWIGTPVTSAQLGLLGVGTGRRGGRRHGAADRGGASRSSAPLRRARHDPSQAAVTRLEGCLRQTTGGAMIRTCGWPSAW
ncbi:MAG: LysR substrate-binding domain-containing protein [Marmoricola sp.]